ncbi:hypothetical protein QUA56_12450 [Microcoleus sp. N3A4]|uniref:hypothetical protein n=1 Tax=Microcoleus sp. N3A4 TaxID=3055379 RepID=UPI002FCF4B36
MIELIFIGAGNVCPTFLEVVSYTAYPRFINSSRDTAVPCPYWVGLSDRRVSFINVESAVSYEF